MILFFTSVLTENIYALYILYCLDFYCSFQGSYEGLAPITGP